MALKTGHRNACYGPDEKEDIEEARKIAAQIGIPYHVFNCVEEYEKIVLENFKNEYLQGRTPNPCIWCNALVKFGVLPHLAKANGIDFDKFATGHYAQVHKTTEADVKDNKDFALREYMLRRGVAPHKDQSYFLYRLKQEQLSNILLPLGSNTKEQIREIAKSNGLNVAEKPDSQDFYDGDYNELLGVKDVEGNIVDVQGKVLGKHKGIWNYTIGQRKGLGVSSTEPLYVLELKKDTNEVVVGSADKTFKESLVASNLNWVSIEPPTSEFRALAKIRSTQQPTEVTVIPNGDEIQVKFDNMQKSIAIGQSVVIYSNDIVLGGGVISAS
jgi:tRNA-specific 2-thiouridylase